MSPRSFGRVARTFSATPDSWSYATRQNMCLYAPLGQRATLMSWDVDFVLGLGDAATAPTSLKSYVSSRPDFLQTQIKNSDAAAFSMTTKDFTSATSTATTTRVAPFGVATIGHKPLLWLVPGRPGNRAHGAFDRVARHAEYSWHR